MNATATRSIRLSEKHLRYVAFAHWCMNHKVKPSDLAEMLTLASRAHRAGERWCNEGTDATRDTASNAQHRFNVKATSLGFEVDWNGLSPTLRSDGFDIHLPNID